MQPKLLKTVIPATLNQIRTGATFLSVKGYNDNFGGLSNFGIVFHVDYIKAVQRSVEIWLSYRPRNETEELAKLSLLESYRDTLRGNNWRARSAHVYRPITDGHALIKSVKWHDNGMTVHFVGFLFKKIVLSPSVYPPTIRSVSSLARARLLNMTPLSKFRQFCISDGRFQNICVEHLTLAQRDLLP